jgi:hypothetical protein
VLFALIAKRPSVRLYSSVSLKAVYRFLHISIHLSFEKLYLRILILGVCILLRV